MGGSPHCKARGEERVVRRLSGVTSPWMKLLLNYLCEIDGVLDETGSSTVTIDGEVITLRLLHRSNSCLRQIGKHRFRT
jgi:hypothetical protein